ncbi:MAG: hypothetical protein K8R23_00835 [Chthoniobacter sp.]|nr:hypothetical protein [Chthoniobacter sp.]
MLFLAVLLVTMFAALIGEHFIGPLPPYGVRVLLMPMIMFYGSLALPLPGMLALAFSGGLMWDALHTSMALSWTADQSQLADVNVEVALGWSIIVYGLLGALLNGFRPLFQRGRWDIHCLLAGLCTSVVVLLEYLMLTFRREPVVFIFDKEIWWRIGGAGLVAAVLAPLFFFALNYVAFLCGHDLLPARGTARTR